MSNVDPTAAVNPNFPLLQTKAASPTNTLGKDSFLKLLVAQLKYQNPLSPTDPTQFMSQTAQFTMVEKLEDLAATNKTQGIASANASATGMLGDKITALGADGKDISGVVTGVQFTADGPILKLGAIEVPMANIKEVTRAS